MNPFFWFNVSILTSYILSKLVLNLPLLKSKMTYGHKLKLARMNFIVSALAFISMPYLKKLHALCNTNQEIPPMFNQATMMISHSQAVMTHQLHNTRYTPWELSLGSLMLYLFLLGVLWQTVKYFHRLLTFHELQKKAFLLHKIKRIHVLFTADITPFCWSWLNTHAIFLPFTLLENATDKKLAMRHEFQHLRQHDTYWLHILTWIGLFCFWNPFLKLWKRYLSELQEFACDEAVILRRNTSAVNYAQCLVNAAKQSSLPIQENIALQGNRPSLLYRRINMLFTYKNQRRKWTICAHTVSFISLTTAAFAFNNNYQLTASDVKPTIEQAKLQNELNITATPEVVNELNRIRSSSKSRDYMLSGLKRMKEYQPYLEQQLKAKAMPQDLLAMPLMQSSYKQLDASQNPLSAAGIWQIIPNTAKNLGLMLNEQRDDRLNTKLSTEAALTYLNNLHSQFNNWKLAVIGYEIGEKATARLIEVTGSRDPWTIARSKYAPKELKDYLAMFDAAVIIIHKPSLITG